jgi:hypothetical protein
MYGMVGVSGESLHYLATNPAGFLTDSQAVDTVVYYHVHGPDYHGHFHRHAHHVHRVQQVPRTPFHGPALTSDSPIHKPHACPLLSLVSTLKLSCASWCTASVILDTVVTSYCEGEFIDSRAFVRNSYARGPPVGLIA